MPQLLIRLVVIPCGSAKKKVRSRAGELYLGNYHRKCQEYALALTGGRRDRVLILSAKYGLLGLEDWVDPYDLRMRQSGCIRVGTVQRQAQERGLEGLTPVVALGGRDYVDMIRAIWPHCQTPLTGIGGIGKQLQWLTRQLDNQATKSGGMGCRE